MLPGGLGIVTWFWGPTSADSLVSVNQLAELMPEFCWATNAEVGAGHESRRLLVLVIVMLSLGGEGLPSA